MRRGQSEASLQRVTMETRIRDVDARSEDYSYMLVTAIVGVGREAKLLTCLVCFSNAISFSIAA